MNNEKFNELLGIDPDAVVELMDDELREELADKMAPCEWEEFLKEYVEKHFEEFGEEFDVN